MKINESLLLLHARLLSKQYRRYIKHTDPIVYKHLNIEHPDVAKFRIRTIKK